MTVQFAIEIKLGSKMPKDHTGILGDWMMSNPITQKGFITKQSLLIMKAYTVDVKSNEQCQQEITRLTSL